MATRSYYIFAPLEKGVGMSLLGVPPPEPIRPYSVTAGWENVKGVQVNKPVFESRKPVWYEPIGATGQHIPALKNTYRDKIITRSIVTI
jgi:hypothetical protein